MWNNFTVIICIMIYFAISLDKACEMPPVEQRQFYTTSSTELIFKTFRKPLEVCVLVFYVVS